MRDPRFVAGHRGGLLSPDHHRLLAVWAADCAEHVLEHFTAGSADDRPRQAITLARTWSRGEIPVGVARRAAVASHAAARAAHGKASIAAARAAAHAVATAHMADHCLAAADYALKAAVAATGASAEAERAWQLDRIPEALRETTGAALEPRSRR